MRSKTTRMSKHAKSIGAAVLLALIVIGALLLSLRAHSSATTGLWDGDIPLNGAFAWLTDSNVTDQAPPERSQEEIISDLNRIVEEGEITISMNLNIVMQNGASSANLLIENDAGNRYNQVVEIFRADTGEEIYMSGLIPVGMYLNESPLDVILSAGEYDCVARFNAVDGNGNIMGMAQANVMITVLS